MNIFPSRDRAPMHEVTSRAHLLRALPRCLFLLCVLLTLLAVPAQARTATAAITVVDDQHTAITLAAPPRRIISLAPNVTEILFALGLGPKVVAVSSYSTYPKA